MWHFFRSIWENIEHHVFSFRNQFIAGGVAGCGVLLRVSPPDTLTILTAVWVLVKAAGIGAATAIGGMWAKSLILGYRKYRKRKRYERHKRQIEEGKRKECA